MKTSWTFRVADRSTALLNERERLRGLAATASSWRERAGIPANLAAVGLSPEGALPPTLLGLRIGTYEATFDNSAAGRRASVTVRHDALLGEGIRVSARPPGAFADPVWPLDATLVRERLDLNGILGKRSIVVQGFLPNSVGHDDDLDGYLTGEAGGVILGNAETRSISWSGYLLGIKSTPIVWHGTVGDIEVTLEVLASAPRWSGMAAAVRRPREHRSMWSVLEQVTWRRAALPPDLPPVSRVDLRFGSPVDVTAVENFLLSEFLWPLHLFAGQRVTPAGVWDDQMRVGSLVDLGRPVLQHGRRVLPSRILLPAFLDQVIPTWQSLDPTRKHAIKAGISIWDSLPADLEPAVVIGAMGLEHLAESLLPAEKNSYDLSKQQRTKVRNSLREAANSIAPGSQWLADLARIEARLFQVPASDRVSELCLQFGIQASPEELRDYVEARNPVTHGRASEIELDHKIRAMLFERQAITEVLLRSMGYSGPVSDVRAAQRNLGR